MKCQQYLPDNDRRFHMTERCSKDVEWKVTDQTEPTAPRFVCYEHLLFRIPRHHVYLVEPTDQGGAVVFNPDPIDGTPAVFKVSDQGGAE